MCRDLVCMLSPEPEEGFCTDFCVHSDIWSCLKEVCSVQVLTCYEYIDIFSSYREGGPGILLGTQFSIILILFCSGFLQILFLCCEEVFETYSRVLEGVIFLSTVGMFVLCSPKYGILYLSE